MASINQKEKSPYWMAKFRDETGRIVMRSTKQTDAKKARKVAEGWEDAAKKARNGELTRATALKVLAELVEKTTGEILVDATARDFLTDWLNSRKLVGRASGTIERYRPIITRFLGSLGLRAEKSIRGITALDITRFRDSELGKGQAAVTVNLAVKVLKAAFERGIKTGLMLTNPASELEGLEEEGSTRQPFNDAQLSQLLTSAPREWQGMILLGAHLGLRMSDAANLRWAQFDLENDVLTFTPRKTRRSKKQQNVSIALHSDVSTWLKHCRKDCPSETAVFPSLVGRPTGSHTGLSNEFGKVMAKAGILPVKSKGPEGKGRQVTLLSFHSLRHSCVSRLANADVSADVRKTISRHSTDEAHSRYTHLELETQKRALLKVGSLLPP